MLRIAIVLAIALRISLILLLGDLGPPDAFRASDSITYTTGAQSLASRGEFLDDHWPLTTRPNVISVMHQKPFRMFVEYGVSP